MSILSRRALMASTSAKAAASRRVTFACSPFIVWMLCHQKYAQGFCCCLLLQDVVQKAARVGGLCIQV
jgi:hypothetical protein